MPPSIQMLVPYVKDGGSDQRARLIAKYLARELGREIEVVNRTGAVTGHTAIAQAAPDGATIGLITGEIGMMHWHAGLTALTPADYTALAVPFVESSAIIVRHDAPFADLRAFLEHCRNQPVVGSGGPDFSVWKFSLLGLLRAAGQSIQNVQWIETYSGEQGLANVLEGRALVAPITMTDARGPLRAGTARALASMEDVRHASFPEVPTVQEAAGIPWSVAHWRGIVAPRGLPEALRQNYIEALQRVSRHEDFQAEARASSFTVRWRFGDDFADYMAEDDQQFGQVIQSLGAKAGSTAKLL
ncbi:tripartite tricarboxylate transporter substrate binding protein [Variovorax sp. HJSM1_2]|uniref:tripartite tricarboxylate transporter substrate binding protein n=1 Tax=Variovorax sp. HJSM1_2 TaxID=3366263 RepID=UPI003BE01701